MTPGQLKGTLLEYLVRQLMHNNGFNSVNPDGHYVFKQDGNGLFFINGKGAAHDADVLMEPPLQLPFSYPTRLLFECKSYESSISLSVIRNALGLRYDINEFEIVTDDSINKRKNNRRASYAISDRKRFNYQVGVASVEKFSASAFEFAANNKIPLLSLRWFLPERVCDLFHSIDTRYLARMPDGVKASLYSFLKDKGRDKLYEYPSVNNFLEDDQIVGKIIRSFNSISRKSFIGLIETGDLIFLFGQSNEDYTFLYEQRRFEGLRAQIHYQSNDPNQWMLELFDVNGRTSEFSFFVPHRIMSMWRSFSLDKGAALDLKQEYFSRIFIFINRQGAMGLPFILVNIDRQWLDNLREG